MFYPTLLWIHAGGMGLALLMFVAGELLLIPARKGLPTPARMALHVNGLGGIATTIGVLAGIALFIVGGWPLTPWLITSLVLIALLMLVERRFVTPWQKRARPTRRGMATSDEVKALARDGRALLGRLATIALFSLIALLMVTKPQLGF